MPSPDEWFNGQLQQFCEGRLSPRMLFDVGIARPFRLPGWESIQLVMKQSVITKAFEKHRIEPAALASLPGKVANPVMVFRSRTVPGAFTLLLDAKMRDESLIVAIHFGELQGRGRFGLIPTIHPKPAASILWWIEQGDCVLKNQKKCQDWLQNSAPSNWEQYAGRLGVSTIPE